MFNNFNKRFQLARNLTKMTAPYQFKLPANHHAQLTSAIFKHVKRFRTAIDAGAHHGIMTRRFAQRFNYVVSFEPYKENFEELCKQLPCNVSANNVAVGRKAGKAVMMRHGRNSGTWHVVEADNGIPIETLDSFQLNDVDLIKLDVEGFELYALEGALSTILKCRPVIVLEDNVNRMKFYDVPDNAIPDLMAGLDYVLAERIKDDYIYKLKGV